MPRFALPAAALLLLMAAAASAETVRLRSGKTLEVDGVRILEGRIQISLHRDGGVARVDLPFDRLDASGLLDLIDRHTDARDPVQRLRSARLAFDRGLLGHAARRYREAARLDPSLAPARDAGLGRIRRVEASAGLRELETQLRTGADPHGALALASALLAGPHAAVLTPAQRARAASLGGLARRLFKRDQRRAARALLAQPKLPQTPPPDPVPAGGAAAALLARADALTREADIAREAAADPKLSPSRALRQLETAAAALRAARRLLREAPAVLQESFAEACERLRLALTAAYLEQADLFRQLGRFVEARARVRTALILDPGNEHAWTQRRLIEDDLRRDPVFDHSGYGFEAFSYSPSPFYRFVPTSRSSFGLYRYRAHGGFRLHFGSSPRGTPTTRVVGRRR